MFIIYSDFYELDEVGYFMIKIEYEEVLRKFTKIIDKDDEIRIYKNKMGYVKVEEVEYIEEMKKMILIKGKNKGKKYLFYINNKDIIELYIKDFDRMDLIKKLDNEFDVYKIYRESVSDIKIRNESFRILKEYMNNKIEKVVFGYDILSKMENNNIKVVFVNRSFVKNLKNKWFKIFTNKENKYKDVNIVVFEKGEDNYKEIKNNGGIIGVIY